MPTCHTDVDIPLNVNAKCVSGHISWILYSIFAWGQGCSTPLKAKKNFGICKGKCQAFGPNCCINSMKLKCEKEGNASANKWMEWNKNGKVSGSLSLVNGLSAEQSICCLWNEWIWIRSRSAALSTELAINLCAQVAIIILFILKVHFK